MQLKNISVFLTLVIISIVSFSCGFNSETHTIETPVMTLKSTGPIFKGPNTATASWEFNAAQLLELEDQQIDIKSAEVIGVKLSTQKSDELPKIADLSIKMKSKYIEMTKIGELETNLQPQKDYDLKIASRQGDLYKSIIDEKIFFVADYELLADEYDEDLNFDLEVTFEIKTSK